MAKHVLTVTPDVLSFRGHYTHKRNCRITLQNTSPTLVYFKLSSTLAKGPEVTPNRGMLKQYESCEVDIVLGAFGEDPSAMNIRFKVEYLQKEDTSVIDSVENVFKYFQGHKPFHMLSCKFFGTNPFDELNGNGRNMQFEDLQTEVEFLRKENRELKIKIALNASKSSEKIENTFTETIGEYVNIAPLYAIEESIDNSFGKLLEEILLKKQSVFQKLWKIRESYISDLQTHFDKLQQYKETMNKHSRTLSDADENFKLEVYHDVHEFYKSRVDELSQQAIPEPRLYFRINQESIETCLDANIKFGIEN